MKPEIVALFVGPEGHLKLLEADLAQRNRHGLRIRGTKGRIEWLAKLRKSAKKGGEARAKQFMPNGYPQGLPRASGNGYPTASAPVPAPVTAPAPAPAHDITNAPTRARARDRNGFDFDAIYRRYPRKLGKKPGLAKCASLIKTQEDFDLFAAAVESMAEIWHGHDMQFCPYFSTFVSQERWRDGELPKPDVGRSDGGLTVAELMASSRRLAAEGR